MSWRTRRSDTPSWAATSLTLTSMTQLYRNRKTCGGTNCPEEALRMQRLRARTEVGLGCLSGCLTQGIRWHQPVPTNTSQGSDLDLFT